MSTAKKLDGQLDTVQLELNQQNLVQHLRLAFTNSTTFIAELLQNARRAGATEINCFWDEVTGTLTVKDNGCGISNPQILFSIAESGWDEEVTKEDHPYGIGFLSALFAGENVEIQSNGFCVAFNTAEMLDFNHIPVERSSWGPGASISISGVADPKNALATFAKGFPVPIWYNRLSLDRIHSLTQGAHDFFETNVGKIAFSKEDKVGTTNVVVYLQGVEVYRSHRVSYTHNIVHLDPKHFFGRLPDRDKLVDESKVIDEVDLAVKRHWEYHLKDLKKSLSSEEFVSEWYHALLKWGQLALLNDIPLLPPHSIESCPFPRNYMEREDSDSLVITKVLSKVQVTRDYLLVETDSEGVTLTYSDVGDDSYLSFVGAFVERDYYKTPDEDVDAYASWPIRTPEGLPDAIKHWFDP